MIFCVCSYFGFTQSTLIEFNYHDESYTFYKITKKGDTIKKKQPFSYRNVPVKVVVKDLNTYFYDVTFATSSYDEVPVGSEQNVETLLSGYSTGLNAFNDLIGEVKENDIYQSVFPNGKFAGLSGIMGAFGAGEDEAAAELRKYETELDELTKKSDELYSEFRKLKESSNKVENLFDYMTLCEFTKAELNKLLYDPNLTHNQMVERANMLVKEVIGEDPNLSTIIETSKVRFKAVNEFNERHSDYVSHNESIMSSIDGLSGKLKTSAREKLTAFKPALKADLEAALKSMNELDNSLGELSENTLRTELMTIYEEYEKIKNADFNYEYSLLTDRDVTRVTMYFGVAKNDSIGAVKTRIINVPTHGGLRINTSAGMSFTSFLNGQNSYINNLGQIQEVKGDLFRPAISTMFHCYRQSFRPFTVGGTFGLSVPIEGTKDFMYMAGISGIIGKKQRVIVNLGALGGKRDKLTDGYNAGDMLLSEYAEVPIKSVFDVGVFLGVTFNIATLTGGNEAPSENAASYSPPAEQAPSQNSSIQNFRPEIPNRTGGRND
jgi:hypothetical protein